MKQDLLPVGKTFNQRHFSREEFHYLTAPRVGLFILYDLLDCTFECVRNALCLAINMAASKGANGEFWCELVSSDKYRDAGNYNENKSSQHLSFQVRTLSNAVAADNFKKIFIKSTVQVFHGLYERYFLFIPVSLFFFAMPKRGNLHP